MFSVSQGSPEALIRRGG